MNNKEMIDYIENQYGFKFPMRTRYKRDKNRIYFSGDFDDGEEIEFFYMTNKPGSNAKGYAFYKSIKNPWKQKLINIEELYTG